MKRISLFFKSIITAVSRQLKKSFLKKEDSLIDSNPILSKKIDQKLVSNLSGRKLPTINQLKVLPKFLSTKELQIIRLLIFIVLICLILLAGNFYFEHTVLVPKNGGSYTEGLVGSPQFINPILLASNDVDRDLVRLMFNGLLQYNSEGVLVPDLAEDVQISPDRTIYTFKLKENVVWHDGEPFTADDVIFTISSIQDPEWQSQLKSALDNVQIEKIDDYNFRLKLKDPVANFINSLTFGILPEHLWLTVPSSNSTLAELNKKPVGTGPYQFKTLTKDKNGYIRTMTLEKNDKYYGQEPYIKELNFKFYGDFETATDALANNNVEGISLLKKEFSDKLEKSNNIKYYSLSLPQYTAVFFNTKRNEALNNKNVRQALAYAIDRQEILNESLDQKGAIINGPILPGYIGYYPDIKKYPFDPNTARQLLKDAGYTVGEDGFLTKDDETLQLTLTTVEKVEYVNAVELIKKDWEAVGVNTIIDVVSKERIRPDIIERRNYDVLLFGQIIKSDPYPFWHSSQIENPGANLAIWANRNIDNILEEARSLENIEDINQKYIEFQSILAENVPAIFLYNPINIYPVDEKIKGITTRRITAPADRFTRIADWYIKTKRKFSWSKPEESQ